MMQYRVLIINSAGDIATIDTSARTMLGDLVNVILAANPELRIRTYEKGNNGYKILGENEK